MKEKNLPKIYQVIGIIAFTYAVMLLLYAIYYQFFYVDGTWFHGFTANGFSVLSGLIWIGILFTFKRFLNKVLNYTKSNSLINAYLIFLGITTLSLATVVYKSLKVYSSLEEGETFNSLTTFASTSILGAIFLFISNFAIILICFLLGNQIRKIDIIEKQLFKILGFTFIGYGIISLLVTFGLLGTDAFQFLIKAGLSILIGLIIKKVFKMNYSDLNELTNYENYVKTSSSKIITEQKKESYKLEKTITNKNTFVKENTKVTYTQNAELPILDLERLENKELVLSYFKNLPITELNRLENIVQNKYDQNLTNEQKHNLVLHYIVENKLYDHQRFLPK